MIQSEQIRKDNYRKVERWNYHDPDILRRFVTGGASSSMSLIDSFAFAFDSLGVGALDFGLFFTTTPFNVFFASFLNATTGTLGFSGVSSLCFRGCAIGCVGLLRSFSLAATALYRSSMSAIEG
jgi:hypothetical protein